MTEEQIKFIVRALENIKDYIGRGKLMLAKRQIDSLLEFFREEFLKA